MLKVPLRLNQTTGAYMHHRDTLNPSPIIRPATVQIFPTGAYMHHRDTLNPSPIIRPATVQIFPTSAYMHHRDTLNPSPIIRPATVQIFPACKHSMDTCVRVTVIACVSDDVLVGVAHAVM